MTLTRLLGALFVFLAAALAWMAPQLLVNPIAARIFGGLALLVLVCSLFGAGVAMVFHRREPEGGW